MKGGAAARLRGELARLGPLNPFEVLGVAPSASIEVIHSAFLAATKKYHPNLFGRESAEVQELATEVFLVVRRAYGLLTDDTKRKALRDRLQAPAGGAGPHPAMQFAPATPLPTTPGRGVTPSRPAAPTATPPRGTPPTPPAPPAPPPSAPAPSLVSAPSPSRARPTPRSVTKVNPASTQPKGRVGSTTDVQAILDAAKVRTGRFDQANRLALQGQFAASREILQKIAAEDPQNRRYRTRLHHVWGLEHRAERRYEDAVRELERALNLDPENADVADALSRTREQREASRGIISKLLRR